MFLRVSAVDGIDGGWTMDDTVAYAKELKARGVDVIDCSSGGLFGSATAARVKRSWGFQVPYAERVRREAGIKSMAVGLIVDPFFAEEILQKGQADLIAIAREALVNPCWPQMAEIALGRKASDAMDDWPVQYGWWLKHRERSIAQIREDELACSSQIADSEGSNDEADDVSEGKGAALGLVEGKAVIDLGVADPALPKDLKSLIAAGPSALAAVKAAAAKAPASARFVLDAMKPALPIVRSGARSSASASTMRCTPRRAGTRSRPIPPSSCACRPRWWRPARR